MRIFASLVRLVQFVVFLTIFTGLFLTGGFAYLYYNNIYQIPQFKSIDDYRPKLSTILYSVDGQKISEFATEKRILVPYEKMPSLVVSAFVAAEDKNFFEHSGFDYLGIIKAIWQKVSMQRAVLRGASTLTQQVAKSLLVYEQGFKEGTKRTLNRKIKEAILTRELERVLTKEQILWIYLNQVYLGQGAYGVQAAAQVFFDKDISELDLGEVALLAGLPQAPSRYSPVSNRAAARERQKYVLGRMVEQKFITKNEMKKALERDLAKKLKISDGSKTVGPYFAEHVRRHVLDKYGEKALYEGGLKIYATMDVNRQIAAENAISVGLKEVDKRQGWRGPIANIQESQFKSFAKMVQDELIGKNLLEQGESYLGVIIEVHSKENFATVRVGDSQGKLSVSNMRWARTPNPRAHWKANPQNDVSQVLALGDIVLVKPVEDSAGVEEQIFALDQLPLVEGALMAIDLKSQYVEAMVGGYSFARSEFNRAFQSCRQPGSSFKPIPYAAAVVLSGFTPATMILDTPLTFFGANQGNAWRPQNFEKEYRGEVTCREAIMKSMNVPTLNVMASVGIDKVVDFAESLGIETKLKRELGTALGSSCVSPYELTNVFTIFARLGLKSKPIFIKRIINAKGEVLEDNGAPEDPWDSLGQRFRSLLERAKNPPQRVMNEQEAHIISYFLTQVVAHGTGTGALVLGRDIAGKTGTTNDNFDTWFEGFSPSLAAGVWVGYDKMEFPLAVYEQGGRTALPVWIDFMRNALFDLPEDPWPVPDGICRVSIDSSNGKRAAPGSVASFVAPFKCGTEPAWAPIGDSVSLPEAMKMPGGL